MQRDEVGTLCMTAFPQLFRERVVSLASRLAHLVSSRYLHGVPLYSIRVNRAGVERAGVL
jgi:hypothetical protein